jgi:Skp family chaperone for outer membrane proteins
MKKLLITASFAASAVLPAAAHAQAIPAAVIAVVDLNKVTLDCNSCKTAQAALRAQVTSYQSREAALAGPLQTEQKSIQAAIDALNGKEPDAALKARAAAFQAKQQQAAQELQRQQLQIQANSDYVKKQISEKLGPIYSQVMQRRGANVMVEIDNTLASGANLDVTNDIVAALNTAMPTLSTTAPAPAARPNQPQGR